MDWAERVGRRIKLRDLHVLLAVAECGSMARAASRLAISHPVVSKTISDLEHVIGVRLFDRSSQGVELTSYGEALLKSGTSVFDELRQGLKQIDFLSHPDSGELRIGCQEIMISGVLPTITAQFLHKFPKVRLHVMHSNTAMLQFDDLRARTVDLVIGRTPRPFLTDDLAVETLFDEIFVAVAGAGSRWARRHKIDLGDLIDEPWVLPPYDSVPGTFMLEAFRANKLAPPQPTLVTLSVHLTTTLIATGRFVGFVPASVVQFSGQRTGFKALPIRLPDQRIAADVITVKGRTLSPLAGLFIGCARDVVKTQIRW